MTFTTNGPPFLPDALDSNARLKVRVGSDETLRRILKLVAGTGVTLTLTDDSVNDEVTVEIESSGGGEPSGPAGGVLDGTYPDPGLAAAVAGAGLAETSDVLSVNVDDSTLEIATDTLQVKDGGVTAAKVAADVATQAELNAVGAVQSYVPPLTASTTNPNLGSGGAFLQTGQYIQIGDQVTFWFRLAFGNTGISAGSGTYRIVLPVAPDTTIPNRFGGIANLFDASGGGAQVAPRVGAATGDLEFVYPATWPNGVNTLVTDAAPWMWAAGDAMAGVLIYPAA